MSKSFAKLLNPAITSVYNHRYQAQYDQMLRWIRNLEYWVIWDV